MATLSLRQTLETDEAMYVAGPEDDYEPAANCPLDMDETDPADDEAVTDPVDDGFEGEDDEE